jgi:hypothetical protein
MDASFTGEAVPARSSRVPSGSSTAKRSSRRTPGRTGRCSSHAWHRSAPITLPLTVHGKLRSTSAVARSEPHRAQGLHGFVSGSSLVFALSSTRRWRHGDSEQRLPAPTVDWPTDVAFRVRPSHLVGNFTNSQETATALAALAVYSWRSQSSAPTWLPSCGTALPLPALPTG